jgi:hypothetical protein
MIIVLPMPRIAVDRDRGHARCARMFEHVAENPKRLPGSRILDPAIGSDSANALLHTQDEKVGGRRIQMARVVIHESPYSSPATGTRESTPRSVPNPPSCISRDRSLPPVLRAESVARFACSTI